MSQSQRTSPSIPCDRNVRVLAVLAAGDHHADNLYCQGIPSACVLLLRPVGFGIAEGPPSSAHKRI